MRRCWRREKVQESQGPRVPRSTGPKDQDISNSHSNTSLTLKKVHLVDLLFKLFNLKSFCFCSNLYIQYQESIYTLCEQIDGEPLSETLEP